MILSLISLSWIDLFVPTGISIVMILLTIVEKRNHVLYYILGSYLTYILASIALFLGTDLYLKRIWGYLLDEFPVYIGLFKLLTGIFSLASLIFILRYVIGEIKRDQQLNFEKIIVIKSIHPFFIFMIGVTQYLLALPSCINMFAFIALLVTKEVSLLTAVLYICIFCSVSIIPKIVVYILSIILEEKKYIQVMKKLRGIVSILFIVCIPSLLLLMSLWGLIYGIKDIIRYI